MRNSAIFQKRLAQFLEEAQGRCSDKGRFVRVCAKGYGGEGLQPNLCRHPKKSGLQEENSIKADHGEDLLILSLMDPSKGGPLKYCISHPKILSSPYFGFGIFV